MINKDDMIKSIDIYNEEGNIFSSTDKVFQIPLYQRAYAWEQSQIDQLIEDIRDAEEDNYYLGSLVVADKGDYYEVIDGQQRLTTLLLLLYCINEEAYEKAKKRLRFACRKISNDTLDNLNKIMDGTSKIESADIQQSIRNGVDIIQSKFKREGCKDKVETNLHKVRIYRIIVPENTDLNRYFEIMNTRGEQLELHHILKAQLMNKLGSSSEKDAFAMIWDACSDMHGYVQMNFTRNAREKLFGPNWQRIPADALEILSTVDAKKTSEALSVSDIISRVEPLDDGYNSVDSDSKEVKLRFESIIEFPHFLIHAYKVFEATQNSEVDQNIEASRNSMIDDRKLLELFDVKEKDGNFSRHFINHLLRLRMLFDKYIIKREYSGDSKDGRWSLKTIDTSGQQGNKKPYFKNTRDYYEHEDTHRSKGVEMIQSALRVSYTSPKVMHWITKLLVWLNNNEKGINLDNLRSEAENIAKEPVEGFLNDENVIKSGGVATAHIVFNYLDYLLWTKDPNTDFVFEFRNSVEHWYPQNPSDLDVWGMKDRFGNLCLIQRNINSKFSNLPPTGKKESYKNMIEKGSLKLRKMSELTEDNNWWRDGGVLQHEKEMLNILREACGMPEIP